jgi:hypothetical protein
MAAWTTALDGAAGAGGGWVKAVREAANITPIKTGARLKAVLNISINTPELSGFNRAFSFARRWRLSARQLSIN